MSYSILGLASFGPPQTDVRAETMMEALRMLLRADRYAAKLLESGALVRSWRTSGQAFAVQEFHQAPGRWYCGFYQFDGPVHLVWYQFSGHLEVGYWLRAPRRFTLVRS